MNHLDTIKVSIPLKKKFKVSGGEAETKINHLTVLNNRYFGEASGSVKYGPDNTIIENDIKVGLKQLETIKTIDLGTINDISQLNINSISRSALVGMLLNYLSGESNRYPWEILNLGTPVGVKSSITIGITNPAEVKDELRSTDARIVKIKMGHEEDILLLDILDKIKDKEIRVDANGGWSCAKAEEMIFHLTRKGVKVIEQPTDIEFISEWKHLKGKSEVAELFVDEGLNNLDDYYNFKDYIDGVNIKMEKSGGIVEALKIAETARSDNKKVMLGCMVESSIGIAQSLYMSSRADYYDLDGPLLLESDIADGITYDMESIKVDREIIGGPKLRRDVLEKYITK